MADKRLLNKTELALFFGIMRPITITKGREALDAVRQHIEAQAKQVKWLEYAIGSWKREEEAWRVQEKEMYDELKEARAEMDAIRYAAHMPDDYEHGLPSWINQHLYGELIMLRDADGGTISRECRPEDIAEIQRLRVALKETHTKGGK